MLTVREMLLEETELIIRYFLNSSMEYLDILGVDPTRLPKAQAWQEAYARDYQLPNDQRNSILVIWISEDQPIGFSSADKIVHGVQASMHLHLFEDKQRGRGLGSECVRKSAEIYFELLKTERLFCEPNAFNIAPNRTLQRAGFKYLKTYKTVPGPLNYHQPVTQWKMERADLAL